MKRIMATNTRTPPTAPPAIAPVNAPLCSAELDPSAPDEWDVDAGDGVSDAVLPEDAGAF